MEMNQRIVQITEALQKTGFLLEREVSDTLDQFKWNVINNRYYIDSNTKTPREIDLLAYKTFSWEDIRHFFVLIVSCKKSESNDWVFLTKATKESDPNLVTIPQYIWTNSGILIATETIAKIEKAIVDKSKIDNEFGDMFSLENNVYAFQEIAIGSNKPQNDRAIYASIDSLLMAADYELKSIKQKKKEAVIYHFNLITVFEGEMYEAYISKAPPIVKRIEHSKYVNKFIIDNNDSFYRLHFCTKEKLPEMLKEFGQLYEFEQNMIIQQIKHFKDNIKTNNIYRNLFRKQLLKDLSSIYTLILQDYTTSEETKVQDLWIENDTTGINIEVNLCEEAIHAFNNHKYLMKRTKELLKQYYKYDGVFQYKQLTIDDIPF